MAVGGGRGGGGGVGAAGGGVGWAVLVESVVGLGAAVEAMAVGAMGVAAVVAAAVEVAEAVVAAKAKLHPPVNGSASCRGALPEWQQRSHYRQICRPTPWAHRRDCCQTASGPSL